MSVPHSHSQRNTLEFLSFFCFFFLPTTPSHLTAPGYQEFELYLDRKALRGKEETKVSLLRICIFKKSY